MRAAGAPEGGTAWVTIPLATADSVHTSYRRACEGVEIHTYQGNLIGQLRAQSAALTSGVELQIPEGALDAEARGRRAVWASARASALPFKREGVRLNCDTKLFPG